MRRTVNGELTNAAQRCDSLDLPITGQSRGRTLMPVEMITYAA
jgi:hypothetical protein